MKRLKNADKRASKLVFKHNAWVSRTAAILGSFEADTKQLLRLERQQSVRRNPLQQPANNASRQGLRKPDWLGESYAWMADGYKLLMPVVEIRDDEQVMSGQYFIQNAASWLPVLALDPQPGETILDVCAAPGGKTSHIAAITNNRAIIWANDNSRPRLAKLQSNMDRLGADISHYTLYDATQLARKLEGQLFDKILLDAPCSGEGLMNITSDKDLATWSVAHIKRLQQLQKRIATQAWQLLRPGGTLVYSTCTMAPEENEAVIDYILRSRPDARIVPFSVDLPNKMASLRTWNNKPFDPTLSGALRLKPSAHIEAFFVCRLRKSSDAQIISIQAD